MSIAREIRDICIIGLGKLGAPMSAVLAAKGFNVIGVDLEAKNIDAINSGRSPVDEPNLQTFIDKNEGRLRATSDYSDAIRNSDVSFIIVPTPSSSNGEFSNRFVLSAVQEIGKVLKDGSRSHIVVVTSTVMPGSTGGEIRACLEEHSGRQVGVDVGLCYNPEFIALGSVVRDMLRPDFILIGESDPVSGRALEQLYKSSCDNDPPVYRMNWVNAELCKISVNTFVTTKISYANMIANMCERLPGADANVVSAAVGADSRIGGKYLRGAVGYGGPCFPRDNKAFSALARRLGVRADLADATDRINDHQIERIAAMVEGLVPSGGRIVILGLSYKPETYVIEDSQGVGLARHLASRGHFVTVYDPMARDAAAAVLGDAVLYASSLKEAVRGGDLLVVMTAWNEFGQITGDMIGREAITIIDPWRIVNPARFGCSACIVHVGRGSGSAASA